MKSRQRKTNCISLIVGLVQITKDRDKKSIQS